MLFPTLEVILTPRSNTPYKADLNQSTIDILKIIFEFKIVATWHIARFLGQPERAKYLYLKMRRLWQAGLLESLQVYGGTRVGMPIYYMLSKEGLNILADHAHYDKLQLKSYPSATSLISSNLFRHEAQVVELASLEAKNRSNNLKLNFMGETGSMTREILSGHAVEVLTPDYAVIYSYIDIRQLVYTEFERTNKSTAAMLRKVERYVRYFGPGDTKYITLRLIFQTPRMETAFWLNIFMNKPSLLLRLRICTTHLALLETPQQFCEPIYATQRTATLKRKGRVVAEVESRVKLFVVL